MSNSVFGFSKGEDEDAEEDAARRMRSGIGVK